METHPHFHIEQSDSNTNAKNHNNNNDNNNTGYDSDTNEIPTVLSGIDSLPLSGERSRDETPLSSFSVSSSTSTKPLLFQKAADDPLSSSVTVIECEKLWRKLFFFCLHFFVWFYNWDFIYSFNNIYLNVVVKKRLHKLCNKSFFMYKLLQVFYNFFFIVRRLLRFMWSLYFFVRRKELGVSTVYLDRMISNVVILV